MKTKSALKQIAEKGLLLKERLQALTTRSSFTIDVDDEKLVDENYNRWVKKSGGNGGERAFSKRLAVEQLTPERAKKALGEVRWKKAAPFPSWVREVERIISILPDTATTLYDKLVYPPAYEKVSEEIETYAALLPFLYYGERRLLAQLGGLISLFNERALKQVNEQLLTSLHLLFYRTCEAEFLAHMQQKNPLHPFIEHLLSDAEKKSARDTFFEQLLAGKWEEIVTTYPVLARLMVLTITYWTNNITEFAQRLKKDETELEKVFNKGNKLGELTDMQLDVSDPHHQGKSVFILTFASGVKIVYKPRSLKIDQAWQKWIYYMGKGGLPYKLFTPEVIDCTDYGWIEFIERKPLSEKADARLFYFRFGVLLGTIYAFGGNDFHYENVISHGAHPVLVDTETLLLHKVKPFDWEEQKANAFHKANDFLTESVAKTGMLPLWHMNQNQEAVDWGALTANVENGANLPIYQGETLHVHDYESDLIEGVKWVYSFIVKKKEQLLQQDSPLVTLFGDCEFRFIIRSTQVYGNILQHVTKPSFLKDGLLYSFEIERMAVGYLLYAPDEKLTTLWNVFLSERDALERRDIPIFYGKAQKRTLKSQEISLCDDYFIESAIEHSQRLISRMDKKDEAFQIELIQTLLSMHRTSSHDVKVVELDKTILENKEEITDDDFLQEALSIYDEIMKNRMKGETDEVTWVVQQFNLQTEKMSIGQIASNLYDGIFGVGTFIAALYRVTEREEIKKAALSTILPFRTYLHDSFNPLPIERYSLGLGDGIAGVIRGLMLMGNYLRESTLINDARTIAKHISDAHIEKDESLDVIGGAAGLLHVLIDLYNETNDEELLQVAKKCAHHLLNHRIETKSGHRVWYIGIEDEPLTGMGHGAAGYAASLYRLATITNDETFYEAAFEAVAYENSLYDAQCNNWPDLRRQKHAKRSDGKSFMKGWCSGAPGIGLARLHMIDETNESTYQQVMQEDIEKAIRFTLTENFTLSDHICCGLSGGIDFLIEASIRLNRQELFEEAKKRMKLIIKRKRANGHYLLNGSVHSAIFNPSFFQGTAGIGYELLRCLRRDEIVSVIK